MFGSKNKDGKKSQKNPKNTKKTQQKNNKAVDPNNPLRLSKEPASLKKEATELNKRNSKEKIDHFMRRNSYITLIMIIFTFFYMNSKLGGLSELIENTLVRNTHYIKENIGRPIFLSANGLILTAKKSEMSFYDERFKSYLNNILIENLFQGLVKVSNNFETVYKDSNELYTKNKKLKSLNDRFFLPNTKGKKEFAKLLYQYIIEDKLPQYLDVLDVKISDYYVREDGGVEGANREGKDFSVSLKVKIISKSWIKEIGDYDTVESTVHLNAKGIIDPDKYADIGNPFGIKFTEIKVPVLRKRTSIEITKEGV